MPCLKTASVLQGEPGEPGRSGQKVKNSPVDAEETFSVTNRASVHLQRDGAAVTNPVRTCILKAAQNKL